MKWVRLLLWMIKERAIRDIVFGALVGHLGGAGFLIVGVTARAMQLGMGPSDVALILYLLIYIFVGGYFTYLSFIAIRRLAWRAGRWPGSEIDFEKS